MEILGQMGKRFSSKLALLKNEYCFHQASIGVEVLQHLLTKYGDDAYFLINHYPGTGDIYLTSMFVKAWIKKKNIRNPVITVIGKSALKVATLFGLEKIELLTQEDSDALIELYQLVGKDMKLPLEIMHYHPIAMHTGVLDRIPGANDINFMEMYLDSVFKGLTLQNAERPVFNTSSEEVDRIFAKYNLLEGKTVLLCPYANTIYKLSDGMWAYLAYKLKEKGYQIVTNIANTKEKPVIGTKGVFVKYADMKYFLEKCGATIQLRSGLSDMISSFSCRKIILYPIENPYQFGWATLYEFFSLNRMGLCDDAEEYEFTRIKEAEISRKILLSFANL